MREPLEVRRPRVLDGSDPTRARPEPWFVGSGRGLMVGVVVLVAILVLARIAPIAGLVQEGRRWFDERFVVPPDAILPRPVPPPDSRLAKSAARVRDPAPAFGSDAYPVEAIRKGEQGRAVARLSIDRSGTPNQCVVLTSSGSRGLDTATCEIALRRLRYDPARDALGVAIPATARLPVRWQLPES